MLHILSSSRAIRTSLTRLYDVDLAKQAECGSECHAECENRGPAKSLKHGRDVRMSLNTYNV